MLASYLEALKILFQPTNFIMMYSCCLVGCVLGEGGFGITYVGWDLQLHTVVALKEYFPTGIVYRDNTQGNVVSVFSGSGETYFLHDREKFLQEARIERAGVFPFSPEEGTPAAKMEFVDAEEAQRRAELVMELQGRIMDEFCDSLIGKTLRVLCQETDPETGLLSGRSYADSPDIDGCVLFEGSCPEGEFADVLITSAEDGILYGEEVTS